MSTSIVSKPHKQRKTLGRAAIIKESSSDYISYEILVSSKAGEWGQTFFKLTCQANVNEPDRAYALQLATSLRFDDYWFIESVSLLSKIQKLAAKQSAPCAIMVDGKPYLDSCELTQLTMALEKLGFNIRYIKDFDEAYSWVNDLSGNVVSLNGGAA